MYWSILKAFYKKKKIALIPPLLVKDMFVADVMKKANILSNFLLSNVHPLKMAAYFQQIKFS